MDIVCWLRNHCADPGAPTDLALAAADELESLRRELSMLEGLASATSLDATDALIENALLREAALGLESDVAASGSPHQSLMEGLLAAAQEILALSASVERLRPEPLCA